MSNPAIVTNFGGSTSAILSFQCFFFHFCLKCQMLYIFSLNLEISSLKIHLSMKTPTTDVFLLFLRKCFPVSPFKSHEHESDSLSSFVS